MRVQLCPGKRKIKKGFKMAKALFSLLASGIMAFALAEDPVIKVDASAPVGPVNRLLFGHNMEANGGPLHNKCGQGFWDPDARASNPAVVAAVKELGIGMMRYPGGCMVHSYDWRNFVGPLDRRGERQFGIDEYMALCRDLGAEPMITVSDYVLPVAEMPAHAAALVEYLNCLPTPEHPWAMKRKEWGHPEPYGVKYFELGNESIHGNHGSKREDFRKYSPEQYVAYALATEAAMKKVDPSIKTGVLCKPGVGDDFDCGWNMAVFKGACPSMDFLILHFYGPVVGGLEPELAFKASMAYGDQLQRYLENYKRLCKNSCGRELPLAVTEYNIGAEGNEPLPYRFSFTAGLLCADMLRVFLMPGSNVSNAEYWQVANDWWGMFETKGDAIAKRRAPLAFYQLWGQHFGGIAINSEVKNPPRFDAPAAGGIVESKGDGFIQPGKVADLALVPFTFSSAKAFEGSSKIPGALGYVFRGLEKEAYPEFAQFPIPEKAVAEPGVAWQYELTFEARFKPENESQRENASLGLGMVDSRGYGKTKSAAGVMGLEKARDWQRFSCAFQSRQDCPGFNLLLKVEDKLLPFKGKLSAPLYGSLEVRNLKISLSSPPTCPAYQGLTASSSISADGKTLHLIVFNKSFDKTVASNIELKGFKATSARSWTVWQDNVASVDYAAPVEAEVGIPKDGGDLKIAFPPHSMTAIDFK